MNDPERRPAVRQGTRLYRPTAGGGLESGPLAADDYRASLRSRRWRAARLANPEVESTDPRIALAFVVGLGVLTFVLLVVGYATGFWR